MTGLSIHSGHKTSGGSNEVVVLSGWLYGGKKGIVSSTQTGYPATKSN